MRTVTTLSALLACAAAAAAGSPARADPAPPRYDLRVELDLPGAAIEVTGTLALAADLVESGGLELSLSELADSLTVELVEPAANAGPVRLSSRLRPYARPGWGTVTWRIEPATPLTPAAPVRLRFSYRLPVGDRTGFIFAVRPEAAFAGGIATAWYPQIEEPTTETDGRLRGRRGVGVVSFGAPPGVLVHASGRNAETRDPGRQVFRADSPVFFSFAAGRYGRTGSAGAIPSSLLLLHDRPGARSYLERASRILAVLAGEFGDYPFSHFAVAEVPAELAGRAGFAGASLDGFLLATDEFLDQPFNTAYFGHEIGHQWWGNLVRPLGREGRWMLSEGMAQYGSLMAVRGIEGDEAAERYRRDGYPGYISHEVPMGGMGYLMLSAAGLDAPLADLPAEGALPRLLVNTKGFLVWDMLARAVGRAELREALRGVVRRHANGRIRWTEFRAALERELGRELGWFWSPWMEGTGAPDFRLEGTPDLRREARALVPYTRAYVQLSDGKEDEALAGATSALAGKDGALDPGTPAEFMLRYLIGQIHAAKGRWPEAIAAYRRALAVKTKRPATVPWVSVSLAFAALEAGDRKTFAEAVAATRAAAAAVPGGDSALAIVEAAARRKLKP
ncbi:MAG TPA: hypothetical protein VF121_17280 [Thermoanaerobaculia bacterium]|nr:hypothetical protein [Thermoanaerobaculia bacterium]